MKDKSQIWRNYFCLQIKLICILYSYLFLFGRFVVLTKINCSFFVFWLMYKQNCIQKYFYFSHNRLNWLFHYFIILDQLLNVWITCSAKFRQWVFGGTNCKSQFVLIAVLNATDASSSKMCILGFVVHWCVIRCHNCLYAMTNELSLLSYMGSTSM